MQSKFNRKQRFSIRKFNVGVASVLLGTALVGLSPTALADEVENNEPLVVLEESPPVIESEVVTEEVASQEIVPEVATVEVQDSGEVASVETQPVAEVATTETQSVSELEPAKETAVEEGKTEEVTDSKTVSAPASTRVATRQATSNPTVVRGRFRPTTQTVQPVLEVQNTVIEFEAVGETSTVNYSAKVQESSEVEKEVITDKDISTSTKVDGLTAVEEVNGLGGMTVTEEALYAQYTRSASSRSSNLIGDDYPWKHVNMYPYDSDPWGMYKRQCTSFVAYRLSSVNKFDLPDGYRGAGQWGIHARQSGYRVDMTPAIGAVAWFGPSVSNADPNHGHVAWVADIVGNQVRIEEYNLVDNPGRYNTRLIPINSVSGYIHFKDLTTSPVAISNPVNPATPSNPATSIPSSGRYTFTSRVGVKAEAKISSPDLAYYNAGMYVNYDRTLNADGYQWISYVNYNGGRSYIPIAKLTSSTPTTPANPTTPSNPATNLPASGRYTFTNRVGVKGAAKISSPDLAYYNAGQYVNYDSTLQADGYQWISYISYSGGRSYIPVAKLKTQTPPVGSTPPVAKPTIPSQGTYTFTKRTSVQAEAKVSSPALAYYNAGSSVRYDRVLVADGHQWISYIAVSGNRRYARID